MLENKKVIHETLKGGKGNICYVCLCLVNIEQVLKKEFWGLHSLSVLVSSSDF